MEKKMDRERRKGEYKRNGGRKRWKGTEENKSGRLISIWSVAGRGTSVYRFLFIPTCLFVKATFLPGFARHPTIAFEDLGLSSAFRGAVTRLNAKANGIHTQRCSRIEHRSWQIWRIISSFFFPSFFRNVEETIIAACAPQRFSSLFGFDKWRIVKAIGGADDRCSGPSEDDRVWVAVNGVKFEEISFLKERIG